MDKIEALKSVVQDIIHDRQEQAAVTMHDYFVSKTREVSGLGTPPVVEPTDTDLDDENDE